jgi:hypothetical protein
MTNRVEIEAAIKQLPKNEMRHLATWLSDYLAASWDQQIEEDVALGKLDALIAKAEADIADNQVRDLDEVLDNT